MPNWKNAKFSSQLFAKPVRVKSRAAVFTTFSHIADIVDKTDLVTRAAYTFSQIPLRQYQLLK